MKGYKAVRQDGTAKHGDAVYEVGKTYTADGPLRVCENGIHFCERCVDVFRYYDRGSRVFEVEALGSIVTEGDKSCTDELRIVRELPHAEIMGLCNSGNRNSGNRNSGNRNSGNRNSGNWNSGDWNSGDWNSGLCNSGDWNSGDWNSGLCNSGDWNSGDWNSGLCNSGDWNSGDWNATNFSSGVLCTEEPECLVFDKPSGMTLSEWRETEAAHLMSKIEVSYPTWRHWADLTDEERELHARCECQGGVLIEPEGCGKPDFAGWWEKLTDDEKAVIRAIPNFDAAKWLAITGIEVVV